MKRKVRRPGGGETLEIRYSDDLVLLRLYKRRLRRKGWAGEKDATEREFIRRKRSG